MSKTAKTDVIINAEQAKAQLKEIQNELVKVKTLRDKAMSDGDVKGFNQLNNEFRKLTSEAGKLQKQTFDVNAVLKNLSSASVRELNAAYQIMNRELKEIKRNDPGYAKKEAEVRSLRSEIDKTNASLKNNDSGANGFGSKLADLGKGFLAMASVTAVFSFAKSSFTAFEESEKAARRLMAAVDGNIEKFNKLNDQSLKLQSATGVSDEEISQIQALGAKSGKTAGEIEKITQATMDWAALTGKDLQSAYLEINKTLTGTAGRITRVDAEFALLTEDQLKNGAAIDLILSKYRGFAEASASETDKLSANWDQFKETAGGTLGTVINPLLITTNRLLSQANDNTKNWFQRMGSFFSMFSTTAITETYILENLKKENTELDKQKKSVVDVLKFRFGITSVENAFAEAVKTTSDKVDKEANAYEDLQKRLGELSDSKKDYLVLNKKFPPEMEKELSSLEKQIKAIDGTKESIKPLKDAFAELGKQISDLDVQINNAVADGNDPLVKKLSDEKKAAELLLDTYKIVKEQLAKGWSLPDLGSAEQLVSAITGFNFIKGKTTTNVKSKSKSSSPLKKVDTDAAPATPEEAAQGVRDRVAAEEAAKVDLNAQIKEAAFQTATNLNNTVFDIVKSRQQAEFDHKMSLLDKERDRELSNKKLTEAQKEAINEKYAKKEIALKIANFKKEQNASAIQALINGALGITKTFAVMGFTPPAWVAAAALAATTLMEIAVIKSAKPPEYYDGGYTSQDMNDRTPSGITHANEFIGSAKAVRNPSVKKIFDIIDYAQRSGTISQINLPALVSSSTARNSGVNSAGNVLSGSQSPGAASRTSYSDDILVRAINILDRMDKNGVRGNWSLFDLEKIQKDKSTLQSAVDM